MCRGCIWRRRGLRRHGAACLSPSCSCCRTAGSRVDVVALIGMRSSNVEGLEAQMYVRGVRCCCIV